MVVKKDYAIIKKYLDKWRDAILIEYNAKYKASGALGRSLVSEETKTGGKLVGNRYIGALIYGRSKTTSGGSGGGQSLYSSIYQWINDKGIAYKDEKEHKSIAYAITRTIHEKGIKVPNNNNDGNLIDFAVIDKDMQKLSHEIGKNYAVSITSEIIKQWQRSQ